jgi:hypothetical protein
MSPCGSCGACATATSRHRSRTALNAAGSGGAAVRPEVAWTRFGPQEQLSILQWLACCSAASGGCTARSGTASCRPPASAVRADQQSASAAFLDTRNPGVPPAGEAAVPRVVRVVAPAQLRQPQ